MGMMLRRHYDENTEIFSSNSDVEKNNESNKKCDNKCTEETIPNRRGRKPKNS